jgi:hypothetical protein
MIETKQRIMELVVEEIISPDDRELWEVLLAALSEEEATAILELIIADKGNIQIFNDNFRAKLNLLLTTEEKDWHQLIDQEVELIKKQ